MKDEIVIFQANEESIRLEVRIDENTVWLTQAQMAELFQTTRNNITLHISNIFNENELDEEAVGKESLLTASDGKKYKTKLYNLDVIISVGYRVKSIRGTQFRIWANKILKEYLLKGYAINYRVQCIENDLIYLKKKVGEFDLQLQTSISTKEGIFFDGQVFDAYVLVSKIIKTAQKSIILIDNYVDESVLAMLSKRSENVNAIIYTSNYTRQLKLDIKKHNFQYPPIVIKEFNKSHDRFLIIDDDLIYHIGASLKDLGRKWFAISKIKLDPNDIIIKLKQ